jgi:hypothetical protein
MPTYLLGEGKKKCNTYLYKPRDYKSEPQSHATRQVGKMH